MLRRLQKLEVLLLIVFIVYSTMIFLELQRKHVYDSTQKSMTGEYIRKTTTGVRAPSFHRVNYTLKYSRDFCPEKPEHLQGNITVDIQHLMNLKTEDEWSRVQFGGWWKPNNCTSKVKVAVLIPYRNRSEQLGVFLRHMHPVFQRQMLSYRIFVVEQAGNTSFNKGAIYNIGFNETMGYDDYDCYIFHDVDLLAENDMNYYGCPTSPLHMSVAIDKFNYRQPYKDLFGGIQAFNKEHYIFVNGFSNKFWGWGAEDDDIRRRLKACGFKVNRPSQDIGRYVMNQQHHFRSDPWSQTNQARLYKRLVFHNDGLNSINTLNFTKVVDENRLYTLVSINLIKKWKE